MFNKTLKKMSLAALVLGLSFFATPSYAQELCFVNDSNVPFIVYWDGKTENTVTPNNAYCVTMGGGQIAVVDLWKATDVMPAGGGLPWFNMHIQINNQFGAPLSMEIGDSNHPAANIPPTYWGEGVGYQLQEALMECIAFFS